MSERLRFAVATPVFTLVPGAHAPWEVRATIDDVARVAELADRLGYHHLTCCEHVGVPTDEVRRGHRYWDPLSGFGYLAACTEQIRFATNVLVLGYHHPLDIAKRYGTLDHVSSGRVILGVGVGSLEEEFRLLGAPFGDRGARADDALRALRATLSKPEPTYSGDYYSFEGWTIDPCAVQERVPLWVGGRTLRSLRRAAALGDGWCPYNVTDAEVQLWLSKVDVPAGFEVVLRPSAPLDPIGAPIATQEQLKSIHLAGGTIVSAYFVQDSLQHYLEQLEALVLLTGE